MTLPSVAVILLNWNNQDDTLSCVDLLKRLDYPAELFSIVVVDNHSSEVSLNQLISRSHQYKLISLSENNGFAAGNNAGIRYALECDFQFIWILNSDVLFTPEILKEMMRVFAIDAQAGVVSPKIHSAEPPGRIWYAGGLNRSFSIGRIIGVDQLDRGQFNVMRKVDFGVGCSMLVRSSVFRCIGLLDEKFFFYHEDVDFCYRAQKANFTIWYQPAGLIIHRVSSSTKSNLPLRYSLMASARVVFFRKYTKLIALPILLFIECLRFIRLSIILGCRGQWLCIRAYLQGILNGIQPAK